MNKISLKNLHEATAQEVFDQCAIHLLTQKEKCELQRFGCRYKLNGLKCAAGCFINDDEYKEELEGEIWNKLIKLQAVPNFHGELINKLQFVHDFYSTSSWKFELINVAKINNLNTTAIDNLN